MLAITKVVRDIDEGWVFDPSFNLPVRNDRMTIDPTRRANASEAMYLLIDLLDDFTEMLCYPSKVHIHKSRVVLQTKNI